jgi:hypothetical protein
MADFTPHPWQTAAVDAYFAHGGVFVGLDPGVGKTWAAAAIARRCRRALMVVPASALRQTMRMFESYGVPTFPASQLPADATHGASTGAVVFATYTWLQRAAQANFIERYAPTDVLMDEFHMARGLGNSARKRIERYLVADSSVRVGVFTASPMSRSIRDFAFGLTWALRGGVRGLVPQTIAGIEALEARLEAHPDAAEHFHALLARTPGVFLDVGDVGRYTGAVTLRVVDVPPALTLPDTWELPDGWMLESPAEAADVAKMLAYGYWPSRNPRPSDTYVAARRRWAGVVRRCIETGAADTEFQVRALRSDEYAAWAAAAEPQAEPVPQWETRSLSNSIERTARWTPANTLIWAHHRALQDQAGHELLAPVFREGARDAVGTFLTDYRGDRAVCSIAACYQSLNLQHFSHNVVLEPPADPEVWRQLIGRTARQCQTAPEVTVDIIVRGPVFAQALRNAIDAAARVRTLTGKSNPILQLQGY